MILVVRLGQLTDIHVLCNKNNKLQFIWHFTVQNNNQWNKNYQETIKKQSKDNFNWTYPTPVMTVTNDSPSIMSEAIHIKMSQYNQYNSIQTPTHGALNQSELMPIQ
jgi:hypothetical protein